LFFTRLRPVLHYDSPMPQPPDPVIAISMGDPLGIGPEIIVKALADESLRSGARFHVYGFSESLLAAAARAGVAPFWTTVSHEAADAINADGEVVVFDFPDLGPGTETLPAGPDRLAGAASFRFVEAAIDAAKLPPTDPRRAAAIVTAPISKAAWDLAGHHWPGHTELLADRFGAPRTAMMFVGPTLRVVLVTIHLPLMQVGAALTTAKVLDAIELGREGCCMLGAQSPRIAVCGLNPHAGEGGLLGDEDDRIIRPAIDQARSRGIDATGPHPADAVFLAAADGRHDLVVAMYHDQGLIPVKLLDRDRAVNLTLGLPRAIIRASPAHGTAFDIAAKNLARPDSMKAAIELAVQLARRAGVTAYEAATHLAALGGTQEGLRPIPRRRPR
jgi:4-hydroxythreonine-4-phosphate dehydrogenase